MAKTFGQYTGGIQAIQGINEFGAQQAATITQTMGGLANTITNTYKTMNEQEEENSANKELIKGQAGNLTAIKKLMDANPDTKDSPLSQSINEMIVKLGTAGDLNRGQLKGLLKSSEVFTSQLPLTMQLQDKAFLAQTTAGVQKALAALKNQTVKDSKGYDIPVPSFQGGSPEKYQKDLQTFLEQHKKDNPEVKLDVDKAVRDTIQLQIQKFTNDPDLTKADPTYKQHLIRGFEALSKGAKLSDELAAQSSEDYGTGENIMGQVAAINEQGTLAGKAPADVRRGELAAQAALEAAKTAPVAEMTPEVTAALEANRAKADANSAELTKAYNAGQKDTPETKALEKVGAALFAERQKLTAESVPSVSGIQKLGDRVAVDRNAATAQKAIALTGVQSVAKAMQEDVANGIAPATFNSKFKREYKQAFIDSVKGQTYTDRSGVMAGKPQKLENLYRDAINGSHFIKDFAPNFLKSAQGQAFRDSYAELEGLRDSVRENMGFGPAALGGVWTKFGVNRTNPAAKPYTEIGDEPRQKAVEALEASRAKASTTVAGLAKATPVTGAQILDKSADQPAKPDIYSQGFDYKMTIPGVFVNERPLTYEEEKDGIRKWFEENHNGVVPSTIDSIYKTLRPEAALKFAKGPNGENLMHTDKGWTQMTQLTQPKGMTSEEQSDETLFKFGQTVQGRRIPKEAVEGSGIMVNGNFGGGKKRAEAFAQNLQDVATLQESIPALIEMFKKPGHSIGIINKREHGIAMSHLAKIRAAIRVETVGTGPVALPEHEMINKRLGDPNATLTFDETEIAKLQEILNTSKSNLQRQGVGLQVTFRAPSRNGQNPIQQNRVANAANRGN